MKRDRRSVEPNLGFGPIQNAYIKRYDDAQKPPDIQIFSYEEPEEEPRQTTTEICPKCEAFDLKQLLKLKTGHKYCRTCSYHEEPAPEENKSVEGENTMYIPTAHKAFPPQLDENDTTVPFLANIDINRDLYDEDNIHYTVLRSYDNERIKHIKVKDGTNLSAALGAIAEADRRKHKK